MIRDSWAYTARNPMCSSDLTRCGPQLDQSNPILTSIADTMTAEARALEAGNLVEAVKLLVSGLPRSVFGDHLLGMNGA